ncbi:sugar transferase [Calothrix sp. 336/3]|uniref:sugar transferase n=1 Tax=Calothrix sp. 336/3 TaxID=1337936 RepID=UPI0004E3E745|nr:sugar transferase [Calothrix sp. 336/3]AKG22681.1 anti-sigma-factor antagonist (STAS) and sugar transfersase [Calothrix sp. 336/3]
MKSERSITKIIVVSPQVYLVKLPVILGNVEARFFKAKCYKVFANNSIINKIILDFSHVNRVDSSGVATLQSICNFLKESNIKIIILSIDFQLKKTLIEHHLDQYCEFQHDSESILYQISKRRGFTHPSIHSRRKRTLDILGSLVGLLITGFLFIPIAIAIKLDSPGPILFGQIRCGHLGKRFRMWKFRSMVTNAEALKSSIKNEVEGALFKNAQDPRITKVGKFLRKTSLDEIPQFWNVLWGEMSLVGTRPPTVDEVELYRVDDWQRFDVKPGMTGEWQVSGRSKIQSFEDVVELDLRYQKYWTWKYDLKLMLRTISVIFKKDQGAY